MKDLPILFSGPMVRAILDGRKTQTRRVVTRHNSTASGYKSAALWARLDFNGEIHADGNPTGPGGLGCGQYLHVPVNDKWEDVHRVRCDSRPGDRLWVRETFFVNDFAVSPAGPLPRKRPKSIDRSSPVEVIYRADGEQHEQFPECDGDREPWRPSIFMPRWASRITLEVTEVHVERLQEISPAAAKAEGRSLSKDDPAGFFPATWDSINGKRPGCAWADNPWVWAITFRRLP